MNNSDSLVDRYNFIIVDDSDVKIEKVSEEICALGIEPVVITDQDYAKRTFLTVMETYSIGKLPVVFLDRDFGDDIPENGRIVAKLLIETFRKKGGIIFPCSLASNLQVMELDYYIKDRGNWYIECDLRIRSSQFNNVEIDRVCREYLSSIDRRESDIKKG